MKSKKIVSGAMIVAASVTATHDHASASVQTPTTQPSVTADGVTFDMVKLDDDVLRLGGLAQETGLFGAQGEELRLATQHDGTWVGGGGLSIAKPGGDRPKRGRESLTVTNPVNKSSMFVIFDWITRLFFDPATNEQIEPPEWVREEVEKLGE